MDNEQKQALWEQFKALGANAMGMNHYDLARMSSIRDVQLWKSFLTDPEVSAYIDQETQILTQAELRKLASDVSDSRSVGQAQLINAMQKLTENKTTKEGPAFIYCYVPLAETQMKAPNVKIVETDVFEKMAEETAREIVTEEPIITTTMNINTPEDDDEDIF